MPAERFDAFLKGEVYLQAGAVLPVADALDAPWPNESTHRFALAKNPAAVRPFAGGSFRLATSAEWPVSSEMCGSLITIRPGGMLGLHWHPNSNEWNYVLAGHAEVSLYGARGRGPRWRSSQPARSPISRAVSATPSATSVASPSRSCRSGTPVVSRRLHLPA